MKQLLAVLAVALLLPTMAMADMMAQHLTLKGTAPTVSSSGCGTSPSVVGNDAVGLITIGGSPLGGASCTMTFAASYTNAPVCFVVDYTSHTGITATTTTTTLVISNISQLGLNIGYICLAYQ